MSSHTAPEDSMGRKATVELIDRYHGVTQGHFDRPEEVLTADVVLHEGQQGEARRGFEDVVGGFNALRESFPDFSVDVHNIVVDGEMAVSRHTTSFTFTNEFNGIEPTGERVDLETMSMFRVERRKIAEIWDAYDTHYINQKFGLIE